MGVKERNVKRRYVVQGVMGEDGPRVFDCFGEARTAARKRADLAGAEVHVLRYDPAALNLPVQYAGSVLPTLALLPS